MTMKRLMQRWQWEVCKMFLYMSFPVACFHYFNTPQIFEEAVTRAKQLTCPPTPPERKEKIENMIREINAEREQRRLNELESNQRSNKTTVYA